MVHYLVQATFTPETWTAMMEDPEAYRGKWVRIVVGKLGGRVENVWLALGEYDAVVICQLPDNVRAAALSMALSATGSLKELKTTPLLTVEEGVAAMKRAAGDEVGDT